MERYQRVIIRGCAAVSLLGAAAVPAQQSTRRGGGPRATTRLYYPTTVATVVGLVERIHKVRGKAWGASYGLHVSLRTDTEEIPVHLGPRWYLAKQALQVAEGDRIEVRGSRITHDGKPALIAAEVTKGDAVLTLRHERGIPAWSGSRGR